MVSEIKSWGPPFSVHNTNQTYRRCTGSQKIVYNNIDIDFGQNNSSNLSPSSSSLGSPDAYCYGDRTPLASHGGKPRITLTPLVRPPFSDVTVVVGEGRGVVYALHRLVLCACSDFFNAALTGPWACAKTETLDLRHIEALSPVGFEAVVTYMYTGRLVSEKSSLATTLKAAAYLQMNDLVSDVVNQLKPTCTRNNIFDILSLGLECCAFDLVSHASALIAYYWDELTSMHGTVRRLAEIPGSLLRQILSRDTIYAKDEFVFYKTLVKRAALRKKLIDYAICKRRAFYNREREKMTCNEEDPENINVLAGGSVCVTSTLEQQELRLTPSAQIDESMDKSLTNCEGDANNQNPDMITPNSDREAWGNRVCNIKSYSCLQGNIVESLRLSKNNDNNNDDNSNNNNNNNNNNDENGENDIESVFINNYNSKNNRNASMEAETEERNEVNSIRNPTNSGYSRDPSSKKLILGSSDSEMDDNNNNNNDNKEEKGNLIETNKSCETSKKKQSFDTEDICSIDSDTNDKVALSSEREGKKNFPREEYFHLDKIRPLDIEEEESQESSVFDLVMLESMTLDELKYVKNDGLIGEGRILDILFSASNGCEEEEENLGIYEFSSINRGTLYGGTNRGGDALVGLSGRTRSRNSPHFNNGIGEDCPYDGNADYENGRNGSDDVNYVHNEGEAVRTPCITPEISPFFTVYPKAVIVESPQTQIRGHKFPLTISSSVGIPSAIEMIRGQMEARGVDDDDENGVSLLYRRRLIDRFWSEKIQSIYTSPLPGIPIPQKRFSCSTSIYWDIPAILSKQDRRESAYNEEGQPRYIRSDFMQDSRGRVFTCVVYPFGAKEDNVMSAYIYSHPTRVPRNSRFFNLVNDNNYSWLSKFRIVAMIAGSECEGYAIESIQHVFCTETNNWGWSEYLTLPKANDLHLIDLNTNRIRLRVSIVSCDMVDNK